MEGFLTGKSRRQVAQKIGEKNLKAYVCAPVLSATCVQYKERPKAHSKKRSRSVLKKTKIARTLRAKSLKSALEKRQKRQNLRRQQSLKKPFKKTPSTGRQ